MSFKIINATDAKVGTTIMIESEPCIVKSLDVSKTGKHGSSKVRIEAVGIFDGKKRVMAKPGHERFDVPMLDKRKAQILSIAEDNVSVMDLESFETIELKLPGDEDMKNGLTEGSNVEYWDIEGRKVIKRLL